MKTIRSPERIGKPSPWADAGAAPDIILSGHEDIGAWGPAGLILPLDEMIPAHEEFGDIVLDSSVLVHDSGVRDYSHRLALGYDLDAASQLFARAEFYGANRAGGSAAAGARGGRRGALAVLPASQVPETVARCAQRGIAFGIVLSGGFRETGPEGAPSPGPARPHLPANVRELIDFLVREKGMDPADAYVLCSVALDLRVTQIVDGTKGIHGMMPKAILEGASP